MVKQCRGAVWQIRWKFWLLKDGADGDRPIASATHRKAHAWCRPLWQNVTSSITQEVRILFRCQKDCMSHGPAILRTPTRGWYVTIQELSSCWDWRTSYQVASWSSQPFGHNRQGLKSVGGGDCLPLSLWGAWSPCNIMSPLRPWMRPTSVPSGILPYPSSRLAAIDVSRIIRTQAFFLG